jgi:hypothetical protein
MMASGPDWQYPGMDYELHAWLEEIADLADHEPTTDRGRSEAQSRALELADKVMSGLEAAARDRAEAGQGSAKPTLADMAALEVALRSDGFVRAADGMRVLVERGEGEIVIVTSNN